MRRSLMAFSAPAAHRGVKRDVKNQLQNRLMHFLRQTNYNVHLVHLKREFSVPWQRKTPAIGNTALKCFGYFGFPCQRR